VLVGIERASDENDAAGLLLFDLISQNLVRMKTLFCVWEVQWISKFKKVQPFEIGRWKSDGTAQCAVIGPP
jgi:hypothetical protein